MYPFISTSDTVLEAEYLVKRQKPALSVPREGTKAQARTLVLFPEAAKSKCKWEKLWREAEWPGHWWSSGEEAAEITVGSTGAVG